MDEQGNLKTISQPESMTETYCCGNRIVTKLKDILLLFLNILWAIIEATYRLIISVPEKSVSGEIVLITGAGHGIGRELAVLYASKKATVVCWDINQQNNEETVRIIDDLGYGKAYAYTCDVSNYSTVVTLCQQVQTEVGDITILINNAATAKSRLLIEHSKEDIEGIMNVNVMSHFWILKAVLPSMMKNNYGSIVAVSSMCGLGGMPNLIPYSATKSAMQALMGGLRRELDVEGKCQIKTTVVYPYLVDTGFAHGVHVQNPIIPVQKQAEVAKSIMRAQIRGTTEVTIPGYYLGAYYFIKLLPYKVEQLLFHFCGISFKSDL